MVNARTGRAAASRRHGLPQGRPGGSFRTVLDDIADVAGEAPSPDDIATAAAAVEEALLSAPQSAGIDDEREAALVGEHAATIDEAADRVLGGTAALEPAVRETIRPACVAGATRAMFTDGASGVVLAGFGGDDTFPRLVELTVEGVFEGWTKHLVEQVPQLAPHAGALIVPFAQRETVDAFIKGIHPDVEAEIETAWKDNADLWRYSVDRLLEGIPGTDDARQALHALADAMRSAVMDKLDAVSHEQLVDPLIGSVAVLPKDELASLAESMVNLTSLARKVSTQHVETVGGDIDVAVISKGDGFVWIKRKRYFDAAINLDWRDRRSSKHL